MKKIKTFLITSKNIISISFKMDPFMYSVCAVLEFISLLAPIFISYIWRYVLNGLIILENDHSYLNTIILFIVFYISLRILDSILSKLNGYWKDKLAKNINLKFDELVMKKTASLNISDFELKSRIEKLSLYNLGADSLINSTDTIIRIIRYIISFFIYSAVLFTYSPLLALLCIIANIPNSIAEYRAQKNNFSYTVFNIPESRYKSYYKILLTNPRYAKELRIYNLADRFKKAYLDSWDIIASKSLDNYKKNAYESTAAAVFATVFNVFMFLYFMIQAYQGKILIGDALWYHGMVYGIAYINFVITSIISFIKFDIPWAEKFLNFLNSKPEIIGGELLEVDKKQLTIKFENVCFEYPETNEKVLDNISFELGGNEKLALVGANGSGKTTIIKLLLRYYDPTGGTIYINGRNIKEYSLDVLRSLYGVCFQEINRYSFTAKENIALSDFSRIEETDQIKTAAHLSGIDSEIEKWESGYETPLTRSYDKNGEELSGGQWQKFAISRAFFRDAPIIILDEPASNLDAIAEEYIYDSFYSLLKDRCGIIVCHRLSAMLMVDRILYLENGRIIEEGTHRELIDRKGKYYYIYKLQADKYAMKNGDDLN
ncbi:MAG: ABC transporter ATP-binding protein [Eubacteriales bacterium]